MHSKKTAFIVEHDFIMATYLADRVIVYEGEASKRATAKTPTSLQLGEVHLWCLGGGAREGGGEAKTPTSLQLGERAICCAVLGGRWGRGVGGGQDAHLAR